MRVRLLVLLMLTAWAPREALAQIRVEAFTRFVVEGAGLLGASMAIHHDRVILGDLGPSAYVFQFDGVNWWMFPLSLGAERNLYTKVDIHGDVAIIGYKPQAYVFRFNGLDWVQEAVLEDDAPGFFKDFGLSVAIDGDVAMVGSRPYAVHVFRFDGRNWVREAKLVPSYVTGDKSAYGFANQVVLDGNRALVAKEATIGDELEAVFAYRFDGVEWVEEGTLMMGETETIYHADIALDGDTALVNADYDDEVHVFRHDGVAWRQEAVLAPPDLGGERCACRPAPLEGGRCADDIRPYRNFGRGIAIDGDIAVVGAIADDEAGPNSGAVHIFHFDGSCWNHEEKLLSPSSYFFGLRVAIDGDSVLARDRKSTGGVQMFRVRNLPQ